jgi:hypothetical protein
MRLCKGVSDLGISSSTPPTPRDTRGALAGVEAGGFVDKTATDHAHDRGCHGFLFSAAGAFVGAAAFGRVMLVALVRRRLASARRIGAGRRGGRDPAADLRRPVRARIAGGTERLLEGLLPAHRSGIGRHLRLHGPWWTADGELLGMGPLVVALLPAAGRVATLAWLLRTPVAFRRTRPAGGDRRAERARAVPAFNLRTSHFLRSSDFVRGQLRGRSRLCVATLRECKHWSLGRVD